MATSRFSDIDFFLTKNELTDDINVKYDSNAIAQSIRNILLTTKKEKLFSQLFGGSAYDLLFSSPSVLEILSFKQDFKVALSINEPRVRVDNIDIVVSQDDHCVITVTYFPTYGQYTNTSQNIRIII